MENTASGRTGNSKRVVICWLRRDLRIEDNRALARALRLAENLNARVLPLFIFDRSILKRLEDPDDGRVTFIHKSLSIIKSELAKQGSDLLAVHGEPVAIWKSLVSAGLPEAQFEIVGATFNHDYEPSAIERDERIGEILSKAAIPFETYKDQVVFERNEVTKDDGKPYTVFTPFSKKWLAKLESNPDELKSEKCAPHFKNLFQGSMPRMPSLKEMGFTENTVLDFPSLEVDRKILKSYAGVRDIPSLPGTSRLGLHLRFGTVSIRKLVQEAQKVGATTWISELIWREFFMQILWHFPHVVEGAFRAEYDQIAWRNDEEEFRLWCEGKTGYPLVDAGMRELNATGFMHNRVRMVAASFLVKHLLIDWRWGEAYFARKLLDFELSANNGNWQWVAGSGCDAAPYFRVFNPELQLKRFDPKFLYVREWVPEYGSNLYPAPIVDHVEARARVLRAYAVVKTKPPV